jgi:hypothetical protein
MTTGTSGPDASSDGPPDRLTIDFEDNLFQQRLMDEARDGADAPVAAQLLATVRRIGGAGEGADAAYREAIRQLGQHDGAAISRLVQAQYQALPAERYIERWALVKLLADLARPQALTFLDGILATPVPPESLPQEEAEHPHAFSAAMEEALIRTTAVEALRRLYEAGVAEARQRMLDRAGNDSYSVRRALVMALRRIGVEEGTLRERFNRPGDEALFRIRQVDAGSVYQPTRSDVPDKPDRGSLPPPDLAAPPAT